MEKHSENNQEAVIKGILKKIKKVESLSRLSAGGRLTGNYRSAFRGNGIEFDQVREYSDLDDSRLIDWNVTARCNQPFVKSFTEERDLHITFLVDVSSSHQFESGMASKRETAAEIVAAIGLRALEQNDKLGLLLFSSKVEAYMQPKRGRRNFLSILRTILFFEPEEAGTDISKAINYFFNVTKTHDTVVLISDFYDSGFTNSLRCCAARHRFYLLKVTDLLEEDFPQIGPVAFLDPESGALFYADTSSPSWRKSLQDNREKLNECFFRLKSKNIYPHQIYSGSNVGYELGKIFRRHAGPN